MIDRNQCVGKKFLRYHSLMIIKMNSNHEPDSQLELAQSNVNPELTPSSFTKTSSNKYKNPYWQGLRWLIGAGGVMVVGATTVWGYHHWSSPTRKPLEVLLLVVKQETVELTVNGGGAIELGGQQLLKAPGDVVVEEVKVQEGDRVKQGQPLLVLRDLDTRTALNEQGIEYAKLELDATRKQEKVAEKQKQQAAVVAIANQELNRQQEKVAEKLAAVKTAQERFQETQSLFKRGLISKDELNNDEKKVADAISTLKDAQLDLAKTQDDRREKLLRAASDLKDAQIELTKAQLDLKKRQAQRQILEKKLDYQVVTAPLNSLILKVNIKDGEGVKSEGQLLTLGNPNQQLASLQLTTLDAAKVKVNQVARIRNIGPNPQTFTGRVLSVSPQATSGDGTKSSTERQSSARVDTRVLLDRPSPTFIPGSLVSVEIVTQSRSQAIAIPVEVIQNDSKPFVWIKDAQNKAQKRFIQTGLQSPINVEVLSGLKVGETVVVPKPDQVISAGMLLNPSSPAEGKP